MKLKQIGIILVLLSMLVSIFTGCQPQFKAGTYTDDTGRQVDINEVPERIVSFGPSITEILFALGLGEKVVGVSDFSDYPEAAKDKAKVGNAFSPSIETVVGLEPDLVLTVEHEQLNKELETLGLTYLVLDPEDIDGILKNIELVGNVTGKGKEAEDLKGDMTTRISNVRDKANGATKVSVFFIIDATDPGNPWTAGAGSFINDIIDMVGGRNVAAIITGDWVQMSIEQIVASDPDIVIIQTMMGGVPTISKETLEAHPAWKEMTAVKQGKIAFINGDLVSRPGPRIVEGIEEMAKKIHPELFE